MVFATEFAEDHGMNRRLRPLTWFSFAMLVAFSNDAVALGRHKQVAHARKSEAAAGGHHRNAALKKGKHPAHEAAARHKPAPPVEKPPQTAAASPLTGDLAAVRQAFDLVRKGKTGEATIIEKTIGDPAAQKLVE
jgi:soluble lytic murein transglycosylase